MFRLMFMFFGWIALSLLRPDDFSSDDSDDSSDDDDKPTLTQKQHEYELAKRLKREREKFDREREEDARKAEEDRKKAEKKAEEDALKEQGKFKEVADQRQAAIVERDASIEKKDARIAELEAEVEALKPHRENNEKRASEMLKNVPESVRELLSDRDPLKQLEWLDKNPDLARINGDSQRGPKGSRPSPRATNSDGRDDARDEEARRAMEQRARAGF